jgi:hypothetical protein
LTHPESCRAVEVAERFADRLADAEELNRACEDAGAALHSGESPPQLGKGTAWWEVARLAHWACVEEAVEGADEAILSSSSMGVEEPEKLQAHLLRDIFGNLFRSLPPKRGRKKWGQMWHSLLIWNDGTVVKLAQAIYEDRQFPAGTLDNGRLAVLADALEEAGCQDQDILGHLRGPGPHVRGCWAVDLCLDRE